MNYQCFGTTFIQGPRIFPSKSFPLSPALQLLGYTSILLLWKFTTIIMVAKLFAKLASCIALSLPMANFSC